MKNRYFRFLFTDGNKSKWFDAAVEIAIDIDKRYKQALEYGLICDIEFSRCKQD